MAPRFEYAQAEEVRDAFARHGVRYLFIGKSGAILLGYPDTTQDADLFVEKGEANGIGVTLALRELGFELNDVQADEIRRGKDFVQLKNGPFDLDLVFAPDETFEDAWQRRVQVEGFPVCHPDDIIRQQGSGQPGQGPRVAAAAARVPGLLADETLTREALSFATRSGTSRRAADRASLRVFRA